MARRNQTPVTVIRTTRPLRPGDPGYIRPNSGPGAARPLKPGSGYGTPGVNTTTLSPSLPPPAPPAVPSTGVQATPATPSAPPGTPMPAWGTFDPMTDPTYASIYNAEHATVGGQIAAAVRKAVAGQQGADALDYTQDVPLSHQTFHQYGLDRLAAMIAANRRSPSVTSSASGDAWYGQGGAIANQYAKNYTTAETNAGQFEADTGVDRYGNIVTGAGLPVGTAAPGTTIGNYQVGEKQYDIGPAQDALSRAIAAWQANPANQTPAPGAPTGGGGGGGGGWNAKQMGYLAPGATHPGYALVQPAGHPNARWSGKSSPGAGWHGIGGGWYVKG